MRKFGFSSKSAFNSFIGKQPAAYRARIGHTTGTGGGKAAAPMSDAHSPLQRAVAECFAEEQNKLSKDVGSAETAIPYAAAAAAAAGAAGEAAAPGSTNALHPSPLCLCLARSLQRRDRPVLAAARSPPRFCARYSETGCDFM